MKLGRYEVVRELGKGAMGIVYLAKDPLIGRLVALKTIRPAAHSDDDEAKEFQQRFIREAQAAGILNHAAIVTVHDIGQDEGSGVSFIAMEYVEGHNLKEVLAQGKPLTFEQIGEIISQVADALDFAHAKGIVHRDVKPANIILLDGNRAKITDFGIAKIASGSANLTTTGQFLGTPNYMAPEQIKGAPVDGRTDIFSLGICLYECLTRRKPFGGDSLTSISYKIVHEPFPPLREINPQIPDGYEDVVAKCLAKDPSRRYQRGRDLANAIRAVVRGERPAQTEPVLAEETIITRGHEKIPTVEIPFPEAVEIDSTPTPARTNPVPIAASAAAAAALADDLEEAVPPTLPKRPRLDVRQQLRRTLTNVRVHPLWRRPVEAPIFLGIVGALVFALLVAVATIRVNYAAVMPVDTAAESQRKRETQLRREANDLLRQGRIREADVKLRELQKLAPRSPYVTALVARLDGIQRREEMAKELTRQQLARAQQLLQQGIALFDQKKFADSIPLFEEAFHIDPNNDQVADFLKRAQQEEAKLAAARTAKAKPATAVAARAPSRQSAPSRSATAGDGGSATAASNQPAQLTTYFNSPVTDGYVMVKAGSQLIAHENLWEEKGRMFRRKTPRLINVTKELTPTNTDLEVWVVIPSLKITEHKVLPQNFQPGSAHRLTVSFDPRSRKFDYQLN